VFIGIEACFLNIIKIVPDPTEMKSRRFNVQLGTFITIGIALTVIINLFDVVVLMYPYYIVLVILTYTILSDYFLNDTNQKIRINAEKKMRLVYVFVLILLFIIIFLQYYFAAVLGEGLLDSITWFSTTFVNLLEDPSIQSLVGIMTIGALMVIIGRARASSAYLTMGFFLICALPIFSIFEILFNGVDTIEINMLVSVFGDEGIALLLYIIIVILFYFLLVQIIVIFASTIEPTRRDD